MTEAGESGGQPRWATWTLFLGVYLTLHGYHSRDGDQAYRLPLLLHQQDPKLYQNDPFVQAFHAFNPHRGYLALLDAASRPLGLSSGLFISYGFTFFLTCHGLDRLARTIQPSRGGRVGWVAAALVLTAKAGNVGTIHLFEPMLLDRLIALALGWWAIAQAVEGVGGWRSTGAIGVAAWIHPSLGLQLAGLLGFAWLAWAVVPGSGVAWRRAVAEGLRLGVAVGPAIGMMASQAGELRAGLTDREFRLIAAGIQSPQHMLPHLWRMPQWLAAACYPVLAGLALARGPRSVGRTRLAILLAANLALLGLAWAAIEVVQDLRVTLFQPFRLAAAARGLCLVAAAGRALDLWDSGRRGKARVALLAAGLMGDWSLVVATMVELASAAAEATGGRAARVGPVVVLGAGVAFLARHDTDAGHLRLLFAPGVVLAGSCIRIPTLSPRRAVATWAAAWAVPVASLVAATASGPTPPGWVQRLADHCRFGEWPGDDIERLAVWCRSHTPPTARFVGPPGPKTFRLWSRRDVAFNRAASPYHAAGLADWLARFKAHVAFGGDTAAFARAYLRDRKALEGRYDALSEDELADLAERQGAGYILAAAPRVGVGTTRLEALRVEGRYAVFRVRRPEELAGRAGRDRRTR